MSLDSFLENTGKEIMAYQYKELNLYFTNEEGNQLVPEARQVYYNGNTPIEKVIVEQLLRGPGEWTLCHPSVRYTNRRGICG